MERKQAKAHDELEVVSVAPSSRAMWRLKRLNARAKGRPRLAVRRVVAAAAASVAGQVISVGEEGLRRKRRRLQEAEAPTLLVDAAATSASTSAPMLRQARQELARIAMEKARCEALLAAERQMTQNLKTKLLCAAEYEKQLIAEKRRNEELRSKVSTQKQHYDTLMREKVRLWQQVQELQRQSSRTVPASSSSPALNQHTLAKQLAEVECRPLENKSVQVRSALKKKLLIKWHPDKQPSSDHASLATLVMQEMQNCTEWKR